MIKRIITIPFLCALISLSNNSHGAAREYDEARFIDEFTSIDDSALKNHQDYQRWKKLILRTQAGRALWSRYHRSFSLIVHITMGENSGGVAGAETKDFVFDGSQLTMATIVFGPKFGHGAPRNKVAYPILSALGPPEDVSKELKAIAALAHEFGHIENARRLGAALYNFQNQLLNENELGYFKYGRSWFDRPEYQQIVKQLGARPTEIKDRREIDADATAIPLIQEYFAGGKIPSTVQQAIRSYREEHPLALAVPDTQRTLASELDAQLPGLSFGEWFTRVAGPDAGIIWQLGECGERGEDSLARTGDIPACVEANAMLPDGRRVILLTEVGTFKKGVTGPPRFRFGVIDQRGELYSVRRLRDLQNLLSHPEKLAEKSAVKLPTLNEGFSATLKPYHTTLAPAWSGEDVPQLVAIEAPTPPPPKPSERSITQQGVRQAIPVVRPQPVYPKGNNARRFNASGPVEVQISISTTGRVTSAKAVSGHPLLRDAAVEAARRWEFQPTTINGVPKETQLTLTFIFTIPPE